MDDLLILGIGRAFVELAAQREQLLQQLKQVQAQQPPATAAETKSD